MESIANYIIKRTISVNGPSSIYIASHKKLGRKTFLKVYDGDDKTIIDRFEREAKIVADLKSDSIVQIYDFGEADGKFFISMEYVDGQNLAEFIKNSQPDWGVILDISIQITQALAILHSKGYIHRDLKPENILISTDLKIKLTDFGITLHNSLNRVTSDGALLGTPLYMSPEQINNLKLTTASDIFSLGIILYQLTSQIHPFDAEQYGQVFSRILTEQPQSLKERNPELPDWYTKLVDSLLIKEADGRPQNANKVLAAFTKIIPNTVQNNTDNILIKEKKQFSYPAALLIIILSVIIIFLLQKIWIPQTNPPTLSDSLKHDTTYVAEPDSSIMDTISTRINPIREQQLTKNEESDPITQETTLSPTTLLIKTFPWCNVYLDYELIDKTPMTEVLKVKPGKYILSMQNPAYPSLSREIIVKENVDNVFVFKLDSSFMELNVQVVPWGKIFIDGKYMTTTPLQKAIYLTKENHYIEIRNEYYHIWRDSIIWNGNQKIQLSVELKEKL